MPILRFDSATTSDALANRKFAVIPAPGAVLNLWASGATAGDTFGLSIGDRDICVNGTEMNIESSADVVDIDRDQLIFNELIGPGQLFLPVTATAEAQFLISLQYLPRG